MNINMTLISQMITFLLFIWFTMKFVWPPISKAMEDREKRIADGLAAAEEGQRKLTDAQQEAADALARAKTQATELLEQANQRTEQMVEEARNTAREEGQRQLELAKAEIDQQVQSVRKQLREETGKLALALSEKVLEAKLDQEADQAILKQLLEEIN